jgi:hypothetical protein
MGKWCLENHEGDWQEAVKSFHNLVVSQWKNVRVFEYSSNKIDYNM